LDRAAEHRVVALPVRTAVGIADIVGRRSIEAQVHAQAAIHVERAAVQVDADRLYVRSDRSDDAYA